VRPADKRFVLVEGLHRLEACEALGETTIPPVWCRLASAERRLLPLEIDDVASVSFAQPELSLQILNLSGYRGQVGPDHIEVRCSDARATGLASDNDS
jgi:hypothetical protein